ncbi:MAG: tRNA 5-methoxyuridine(34)/uridine 5-oxyacetic acid(34) synthase CmoB [Gammaproteobacteria bacterium]
MDETALRRLLAGSPLAAWQEPLGNATADAWRAGHGRLAQWQALLAELPPLAPSQVQLNAGRVGIGCAADCSVSQRRQLEEILQQLHPWRKGPFSLFGLELDAEWRSDWKWSRLQPHIQPLAGRRVLDVGCGNGYYCLRMAGEGAGLVLGIDPTLLYVVQFHALRRYLPPLPVQLLPLALEDLPTEPVSFDTVFSMGVLYHRRSPLDHLLALHKLLRPGGELVLETLVIEGADGEVLVPEGRYAKMRNVWFIPSPATLIAWLRRCGFRDCRLVDVSVTTAGEQRATPWMRFESLQNFLDLRQPARTVEGYPAPRRALFIAGR